MLGDFNGMGGNGFGGGPFGKKDFKIDMIKKTSVKLPGGGDTHFDIYGKKPMDFTVTTRLPGDVTFHDHGCDFFLPKKDLPKW